MSTENYIPITLLCTQYRVELSFFTQLNELGLIEIAMIDDSQSIHEDTIHRLEKMIRMHQELDINFEGIDTICNLLNKIEELQNELSVANNRLRFFENE